MHPTHLIASHAAAHHGPPWALIITGAVLAAVAWYALACAAVPFRNCWHCHGTGRNAAGARSRCKHCDGTGLQLRYGRRAYTHLTRTRDRAERADHQRALEKRRQQRDQANPWKDPR